MATLYFVRHGITENNRQQLFNGSRSNPDLTAEGIQQAKKLGKHLKEIDFATIYVSPTQRTIKTMQAILSENQYSQLEIIISDTLKEMDFGDWDGTTIQAQRSHEQFDHLMNQPERYDPSGFDGESYQTLLDRGMTFLSSLDYQGEKNYLIVGHGVMLSSLLAYLKEPDLSKIRQEGLLKNTSLSIFSSADGRTFQQEVWNYSRHLE
ncbi:histidine phosphatase family protein [Enterococcus pallens]|uniref:Phosphoglycerate mutase n=1 Tax=Enterococcus pallens ATCC BAA-351 TaxID=1158607 RepID=R2Q580_9ENTE|nr:histidine phosphatase family protein [Enterococcus pallens]EOH91687.1 hypothetical protein UAU_02989 [Enterococcus pallens ATCC BAA-351]EOU25115.1 hypothetical protein I588_01103 [Enterococcus pallens ATCC BAA-351]OJG78488.1 hypothetical protein RV10_GL001483 [Enterococcus pallens]